MRPSLALLCGLALSTVVSLAACDPSPGDSPTNGSGGAAGTGSSGTSGNATSGLSSTGSGTTTGAALIDGCPAGWQPCTPSNLCDDGCSRDGGACVDQLAANNAQTGVGCDAGAVCEGTTCLAGSGPQVPNQMGGVISHPNLVIMTYDTDPDQAALENWGVWIADGGYLPTTVGQYGVGNGTVQFVHLSDTPPGSSDAQVQQYLQTHFDSDATMPTYASRNLYELFFPSDWAGTAAFCQSQGGYHTYFYDASSGNEPIYAVVANCRNDLQGDTEVSGSHEVVEAATDPYVSGWTFDNTPNAWAYIGGELGDLCESNSHYYLSPDGTEGGQYIWSNSAALAGQVPCQPWPDGVLYVDVLASSALVPALPGTTVDIPLTGWASAPIESWALVAEDAFFGVDFQTSPGLSQASITPGGQVMAELNVPQALSGEPALGGKVGAAWIFSAVSDTAYYGSAVVGVTVACETTGDCSNEAYGCSIDGGVGSCGYDLCGSSAKPFSTCSSAGNDDGVCLPFDSMSGPLEVCEQAGSLGVGAAGCQSARVVDAGPGAYCAPTALCEGSQTPSCFSLCSVNGSVQGTCPANQVCYAQDQYYGFCVHECGMTTACPADQTCYPYELGVDVCYPN